MRKPSWRATKLVPCSGIDRKNQRVFAGLRRLTGLRIEHRAVRDQVRRPNSVAGSRFADRSGELLGGIRQVKAERKNQRIGGRARDGVATKAVRAKSSADRKAFSVQQQFSGVGSGIAKHHRQKT